MTTQSSKQFRRRRTGRHVVGKTAAEIRTVAASVVVAGGADAPWCTCVVGTFLWSCIAATVAVAALVVG